MEAPSTPQEEESLLYITGRYNDSNTEPSAEIYPSTSNCSLPPLPYGRSEHTMFMTSGPSSLLATCAGSTASGMEWNGATGDATNSCLVLDTTNQRWEEKRMGSLALPRYGPAPVRLDSIGVFILGRGVGQQWSSSEFQCSGKRVQLCL